MDFSLTEEQRAWQLKARKFAQEEVAPIALERDRITDSRETFDWEIISPAAYADETAVKMNTIGYGNRYPESNG